MHATAVRVNKHKIPRQRGPRDHVGTAVALCPARRDLTYLPTYLPFINAPVARRTSFVRGPRRNVVRRPRCVLSVAVLRRSVGQRRLIDRRLMGSAPAPGLQCRAGRERAGVDERRAKAARPGLPRRGVGLDVAGRARPPGRTAPHSIPTTRLRPDPTLRSSILGPRPALDLSSARRGQRSNRFRTRESYSG